MQTNSSNDPDAEDLAVLKEELIRREIKVFPTPKLRVTDLSSSYNLPFSGEEFDNALAACNRESAPGLDQILYEALFNLPKEGKVYYNAINNEFFRLQNFLIPGGSLWSNLFLSRAEKATDRFR